MTIADALLFSQAIVTWMLTGLIWFIQVVHYPLFKSIGAANFTPYHLQHTRLTGFIAGPLMVLEMLFALLMWWHRPLGVSVQVAGILTGLLVIIWISTFTVQVPIHNRLSKTFDEAQVEKLVTSNWVRTLAWTVRAILLMIALTSIHTLQAD